MFIRSHLSFCSKECLINACFCLFVWFISFRFSYFTKILLSDKTNIFFFSLIVYGLINTQDCGKYKLSNDDPDDAHYISHVDGSLYVNSFDEPILNSDYCVELLNTGTVDVSKSINHSSRKNKKVTSIW